MLGIGSVAALALLAPITAAVLLLDRVSISVVAIRTLWGGLKGDCSSSLKRAKGYNKRRGL